MAMASARPAETLAREFGPLLLQMARRLCGRRWADPEDLVQETFEKALQDIDRLSQLESGRLRGWLCTTLGHRFIDRCRRGKTESTAVPDLRATQPDAAASPEDRYLQQWSSFSPERFRAAVQALKPRHREAYELHASGLRYREIALRLGAPLGSVGFWVSEARKELRQLLERDVGGRDASEAGGGP
ncbi:MAG TPA: RNA polymerase sigma factor [Myxococcales bacterium]|nr:RNA polymerase sigma factor [Myxococcales bacterium]